MAVFGVRADRRFGPSTTHKNHYLIDADGMNPPRIAGPTVETAPASDGFGVEWSPDGSRLAFHVAPRTGRSSVRTVLANGTGEAIGDVTGNLAAVDGAMSSSWSPDSGHLALVQIGRGLVVALAETMVTAAVAVLGYPGSYALDGAHLAWSPDSATLAYQSNEGTGTMELFVVKADGTSPTMVSMPLTGSDEVQSSFYWMHDSESLVYDSVGGGHQVARPATVAGRPIVAFDIPEALDDAAPTCPGDASPAAKMMEYSRDEAGTVRTVRWVLVCPENGGVATYFHITFDPDSATWIGETGDIEYAP